MSSKSRSPASLTVMTQVDEMANALLPSPSPSAFPEDIPHPEGVESVATVMTVVVAAEFS